jgi:3-deoxy-manno-octulosonate cytidylyltransferase (CMP-KDO synthetase)
MSASKVIVLIPARLASTRLPRKLLLTLDEARKASVLQLTYESALLSRFASRDNVYIATGDKEIRDHARAFGAKVVETSNECRSGTDRVEEAVRSLIGKVEAIVNVQGDEPFVEPLHIDAAVNGLLNHPWADVATCAALNQGPASRDPSKVKVVCDHQGKALYFSREPIPHGGNRWLRHIGIYVYRPSMLLGLRSLKASELEASENLEQLRWLENGKRIYVAKMESEAFGGIDTVEDFERAREQVKLLSN